MARLLLLLNAVVCLGMACLFMTQCAYGGEYTERFAVGVFRLDVPVGWTLASAEAQAEGERDKLVLRAPDGSGALTILSQVVPGPISHDRLRNMTNVDAGIELPLRQWGETVGYTHEYVERGEVYRHWWLSSGSALVFATFRSATLRGDDAQQARSAAPDAIIDSLARAEET